MDLHIEADSLVLVGMVEGRFDCPWRLRENFEELLRYKHHFQVITHCFREAIKPADRLANFGADSPSDSFFDNVAMLPRMARGDIRLEK